MAAVWERLNGHKGIEYRQYGADRSYRFRQHPHGTDFFGVMPEERAIRIAGELRDNRATGSGPQSWKAMQGEKAEKRQEAAIVEKKERKRIIAEERFAQENTVGSFWDKAYWPHRSQTGSPHSNKSIGFMFEKWIRPALGKIPLQELTFTDIEKLLNGMADKGMSRKSMRDIYIMLQAEWNYASIYLSVHNKISLPVFPGKMIKLPKLNNKKTCYLMPDEAALLLKTLYSWREITKDKKTSFKGPDSRDAYGMTVLSLLSGLRLGDICRLTWADVETAFAYARTPKGGQSYGIHLDIPGVAEMLGERRAMFPDAKPSDFVFLDCYGKPWKQAPKAFKEAVAHLKLNAIPRRVNNPHEKIDFHACRHTFASWLAMAGTSLQTIMVLMNHERGGPHCSDRK